jgi:3-methyladenine DNA glycosylase AlkD
MDLELATIRTELRALANPSIAQHSQRFFKTGPGQYGAGDRFLGIRVPVVRRIAHEHRDASVATAFSLLRSPLHEERLCALLLLVRLFDRSGEALRRAIYERYVEAIRTSVNNWDLVDTSAPFIVGAYLEARSKRPLYRLAKSRDLWERRVAMLATLWLIRRSSFVDALAIAELLLDDEHDLIHKATGWMLREVGKRDAGALRAFLGAHCTRMPRTMLRYAIEKLPPAQRRAYLDGRV